MSLPVDLSRRADLGPGLPKPSEAEALHLYRAVLLARRLDLRIAALTRQGQIRGAYYSSAGNEATGVGCALALEGRDVLLPTQRDLGAHLVFGHDAREVLLQFFKRRESVTGGRDTGLHLGRPSSQIVPMVSHIGHMLPVAVGVALGEKLKGSGAVALTTIGEGGTSTGDFHEAVNFAAVQRLPVVFVIVNNQYAYSTPTSLQYACEKLVDRAPGYGIAGETVDGTDVLAVLDVTRRAVARGRAGDGPTLLEAVTMRMRGHSEHDDASYVPAELLEKWRELDPVARLEGYLAQRGIRYDGVGDEVDAEIDEAQAWVESRAVPAPEDGATRVFHEWRDHWRPSSLG